MNDVEPFVNLLVWQLTAVNLFAAWWYRRKRILAREAEIDAMIRSWLGLAPGETLKIRADVIAAAKIQTGAITTAKIRTDAITVCARCGRFMANPEPPIEAPICAVCDPENTC